MGARTQLEVFPPCCPPPPLPPKCVVCPYAGVPCRGDNSNSKSFTRRNSYVTNVAMHEGTTRTRFKLNPLYSAWEPSRRRMVRTVPIKVFFEPCATARSSCVRTGGRQHREARSLVDGNARMKEDSVLYFLPSTPVKIWRDNPETKHKRDDGKTLEV